MAIGTHDTNITGPKANKVTFRQTCSNAMLANAVGPELLKHGKKWYFLVANYAFGTDAHERFKKILLAHGGQEVGADLHPLGQTDYSSYLTKARNSDANVLVLLQLWPGLPERDQSRSAARASTRRCSSAGSCAATTSRSACRSTIWSVRSGATSGDPSGRRRDDRLQQAQTGRRRGRLAAVPRLHDRAQRRSTGSSTPARPIRRSSSRRSRTSTTTPPRSGRVFPRLRPSSDPADLRRRHRRQEQAPHA
jgi:hypothetical protein